MDLWGSLLQLVYQVKKAAKVYGSISIQRIEKKIVYHVGVYPLDDDHVWELSEFPSELQELGGGVEEAEFPPLPPSPLILPTIFSPTLETTETTETAETTVLTKLSKI